MPFTLLPISVGDVTTAAQFNEARSAVLERGNTVGFALPGLPFARSPGNIMVASGDINGLRNEIESFVTAYVNPADEDFWSLPELFAAAGIGDGSNWTRVPARKGGLTVSSRLSVGDVIYAEHINEIRLAVIQLTRIRFVPKVVGFDGFVRGPLKTEINTSWPTARSLAIAGAQAPLVSGDFGGTQRGFHGSGSKFGADFTANVGVDQRVAGIGFQTGQDPMGTAPTPLSYASVDAFVVQLLAAPVITGAPPPSNARRIGYNKPASAGVPASFNFGVTWFTWDAPTSQDQTETFLGVAAAGLPTGSGASPDDFGTQLSIGLADTASNRSAWTAPNGGGTVSNQTARVEMQRVHATITNFSFQ